MNKRQVEARAGRFVVAALVAILGTMPHAGKPAAMARAQAPPAPELSDHEIDQHAASLQHQAEDSTLEMAHRESIALELAATLDRASDAAQTPEGQRARRAQAIAGLDAFDLKNPGHPRAPQFRFQSAIDRWMNARSLLKEAELNPARSELKNQAARELDDAVTRFRQVVPPAGEEGRVFRSHLAYRVAQALADRSDLGVIPPEATAKFRKELDSLLTTALEEPTLAGFTRILKGDLLRREGKIDEALAELNAAAKAVPPPPERARLEVLTSILTAAGKPDEALKAIAESHLEGPVKRLLSVQARLARRSRLPADADRYPIDSQLFDDLAALRSTPTAETRLAFLALARARIEPDPRLGPEAWDLVGEAAEAAGDPIRAGAMEERAAVRAEDSGHPESSAGYRLKAGALLFRAGKLLEAEAVLARVGQQKSPGSVAIRAKANLLRAMALGKALVLKVPGATSRPYVEALETQVREFPGDPGTDEARWLLGELKRVGGDLDRARALWLSIGVGSRRWLDSRRAIAALDRERIHPDDPAQAAIRFEQAADFLDRSIRDSPGDTASTELLLLRTLIDLDPQSRHAEEARQRNDRIAARSLTSSQRYRTALLRAIVMAQLGRYVEAEIAVRDLGDPPTLEDRTALVEAVRLLDRTAVVSETDLRQRRCGLLMRMLASHVLRQEQADWPEAILAELHMRLTRSLIFVGDDRAAKASLSSWRGSSRIREWSDPLLRDLADTYARLSAYALDADVQRLRLRSLTPGSSDWLDAKYGLAVALYRAGDSREAMQLIDATAILHPELGGAKLKERFIRLRQKLGDATP